MPSRCCASRRRPTLGAVAIAFEDRGCATPRWSPATGGGTGRRDPSGAALGAARCTPAVDGCHGGFGRGQRGGARRDGLRRSTTWPRNSPRILRHTQTPKWSAPCQDLGPSSAPGCSASSAMSRTATPAPSLAKTMPARRPSPGPRAPRRQSSPATSAIAAWPTPSTCGLLPHSAPLPGARALLRRHGGRPVTDITRLYGPSGTASSASSTAVSRTTSPTTNRSPGGIAPTTKLANGCLTYRAVGCLGPRWLRFHRARPRRRRVAPRRR